MQVGAAHRARADLHQDLARPRLGSGKLSRAERLPLGVKDHRFHEVIEDRIVQICKRQIEFEPATGATGDWRSPVRRGKLTARKMHHMKIAIGSDHAGFQYKEKIREFLEGLGHSVTDFGTHSEEPVDYPLFIRPVAEAVARGEFERGIVLGGSGNGEAMVANRVKGIRCALCWNADSARLGRQHNDANVLSLGQRMMSLETALQLVQIWLDTPFEGGRHQRRIELIDAV